MVIPFILEVAALLPSLARLAATSMILGICPSFLKPSFQARGIYMYSGFQIKAVYQGLAMG
jgi:hypothetical protein